MGRIELFDDPLNPHGWGVEPALRRLRVEFPDLEWSVHPTVLVESWDEFDGPEFEMGAAGAAATCARISERSNMPIDEYLWFEDPPSTSVPACQALAVALDQGEAPGWNVLRALREATFIRRTNVDNPDAVRDFLGAVPDVDADAVATALEDGTADEALNGHRKAARELAVDGVAAAGDRPQLPTVVVRGPDGARGLSGRRNYGSYRGAVTDLTGREPDDDRPDVAAVLDRFSPEGWVSTSELSSLVGVPYEDAATRAGELAADGEAVERSFASESFWRGPGFVDGGDGDGADGP